jgi:PhzF family phenazine biosynthesis protein
MNIRLFQVDSFTDSPYKGNPAGVCIVDNSVSNSFKQQIASEMNCSETAFITDMGDVYRIQYFTPLQEVQLCGHATLATAHILWSENITVNEKITFKANNVIIPVIRSGEWIKMGFPLDNVTETNLPIDITSAVGYSKGVKTIRKSSVGWYLVEVENEQMVLDAAPDFTTLLSSNIIILITSKSDDPQFDFVSRFFAPSVGINEDPVTGYAHITLGKYWGDKLGKSELVGHQLSRRKGIVRVILEETKTQILGKAKTVFEIKVRELPL